MKPEDRIIEILLGGKNPITVAPELFADVLPDTLERSGGGGKEV